MTNLDTFRSWLAGSLLTLGPLALTAQAPAPADLVLVGGKIATQTEHGFVDALAIRDGRVLAIGGRAQVLAHAGPDTRVLQLGGRTAIPGLNDSHSHVVRGGRFFNLELRWEGVRSLRRGLEMIREQARRTPEGQWVRVIGGWSPFQFVERRMPTVAELNAAAPDTPVFVLYLYSKGFLNAAAVEALGLNEDSVPPTGGEFRFVDGGAELLAVPNPTILYRTIAQLPHLTPEQQRNSTKQFYRELNRFGLTSAIDAGGGGHLFPTDYVASTELAQQGELPLRVSYYLFPQRPGQELEDFQGWTSGHRAGTNGAPQPGGYVLQGGGEFLTWSAGDFENFLAPRPQLGRGMELQLRGVATLLVSERWPFRIHATYGESIDRILKVLEGIDGTVGFDGLRFAIDHAETIRPEQIERIKQLGGGIAIQNRMAFAGEYFVERYGFEAAAQAPPLRALLESGVPLGAGSDATRVSSYNPWGVLDWLVNGRTVGGTVLYPEAERLTRGEALRLMTVGSAWFSGEQDLKGRLAPGQLADLAVLTEDYFTVDGDRIPHLESVLTVVGGRIVYGAGPFAGLAPELPPVEPAWSPVRHFGGHQ